MRKKYSKKLKEEIERTVPDIMLNIKLNINWDLIRANNLIASSTAQINAGKANCSDGLAGENGKDMNAKLCKKQNLKNYGKRKFGVGGGKVLALTPKKIRLALASVACILLLTIGVSLPIAIGTNNLSSGNVATVEALTYDVTIDVNPSVRLTINNADIVTAQQGLNKDGVILLYNENFVGKDVVVATNEVMEKIDEAGFFGNDKKEFKFCLSCEKGKKIKNFQSRQNKVEMSVNQFFSNANLSNVTVKHITDARLEEIESTFKKNKIEDYTNEFDNTFRNGLIFQLNEKIENVDNILSNWLLFIFQTNKDLSEFTLDDFNQFCNKYGYPFKLTEPITLNSINDMYITLNKYKSSLLETKEQLSKGVELDNLYKDIYDVYDYAKKWLYSAEN